MPAFPHIGLYVLNENDEPEEVYDAIRWARWFEVPENRIVAVDKVGDVTISTVFLGIDHGFRETPTPILWETAIFGGSMGGTASRYTTRSEAIVGHALAVERVRAAATDAGVRFGLIELD